MDKLCKKSTTQYGMDVNLIVGKDSTLSQSDDRWTEEQTAVSPSQPLSLEIILHMQFGKNFIKRVASMLGVCD